MRGLSLLNTFLVMGLVVFAIVLYGREQKTRLAERQIRKIEAEVAREEESMRILRIEWAMLANPQRLQRLAEGHLKLGVVAPQRIRPAARALADVPPAPAAPAGAQGRDTASLGELIARIQRGEAGR